MKRSVLLLICLLNAGAVYAAEPAGAIGGMSFFSPQAVTLGYQGWFEPHSQDSVQSHRLTLQAPLYKDENDTISASLRGGILHFADSAQSRFSNLKTFEWGGQFNRKLEDGKFVGGRLAIGSASDQLFAGSDVTTVSAVGFYGFPAEKSGDVLDARWILSLFFSNNNPISNYVPIPGFAYMIRTKTFSGFFGIPFVSAQWFPGGAWTYSISAFGPSIQSEIGWGHPRFFQAFTGVSWAQQSFLREGRANTDDRLFYDEKRVFLGTRFPLLKSIATELQGGYSFGRALLERKTFWKAGGTRDSFDNAWFGACNLRVEL